MKRIIISCVLLFNSFSNVLPFAGTVTQNRVYDANTPIVQKIQQPFLTTRQGYTNGGLVLIYPLGLFTNPPLVLVSVHLNGSSLPGSMYLAEVAATSDANSCTIIVYRLPIGGGAAVEAASDEVDVTILAIEDAAG
jgi:hypothetical protein